MAHLEVFGFVHHTHAVSPKLLDEEIARDRLADHFQDLSKGGLEPMPLSEKNLCSVRRKWVYIFDRQKS